MDKIQFRVLFRQFLFRVVDLEILSASARGDASKLLGQFGAILIYFSLLLALAGGFFSGSDMPAAQRLAAIWGMELFLISATILAVGIFAVLSWDSMFPDRRDVALLAPLPIRARTIFLAKLAALATALAFTVVAMHSFASLVWPIHFSPEQSGILGVFRSFAAYWVTMFAAGVFTLSSLLCLQGFAALLPRQLFLRASSAVQLGTFCLLVSLFFLQPAILTPEALAAPSNQRALACLPSYWFLGLFQFVNGAMPSAMAPLAGRAAVAFALSVAGAAIAFALSYFRTLLKIAEAADIAPIHHGARWLPRFGAAPISALVQFSVRTLLRSRQHRLILSFFLGLAFADCILYVKTPIAQRHLLDASSANSWHTVNVPLMVASGVILLGAIIGARVAFAIPIDVRANWIFRLANTRGLSECVVATRRTLTFLAAAPAWLAVAGLLLWLWPAKPAAGHLTLLALLGAIVVEVCVRGFHKIPFACSYLPGKANVYYIFFMYAILLVPVLDWAAQAEWNALESGRRYLVAAIALLSAFIVVRWRNMSDGNSAEIRFEEEPPVVLELGLRRQDCA